MSMLDFHDLKSEVDLCILCSQLNFFAEANIWAKISRNISFK